MNVVLEGEVNMFMVRTSHLSAQCGDGATTCGVATLLKTCLFNAGSGVPVFRLTATPGMVFFTPPGWTLAKRCNTKYVALRIPMMLKGIETVVEIAALLAAFKRGLPGIVDGKPYVPTKDETETIAHLRGTLEVLTDDFQCNQPEAYAELTAPPAAASVPEGAVAAPAPPPATSVPEAAVEAPAPPPAASVPEAAVAGSGLSAVSAGLEVSAAVEEPSEPCASPNGASGGADPSCGSPSSFAGAAAPSAFAAAAKTLLAQKQADATATANQDKASSAVASAPLTLLIQISGRRLPPSQFWIDSSWIRDIFQAISRKYTICRHIKF